MCEWDLVLHVAWGIHAVNHPKNINLYHLISGQSWVPHNDTARNLMSSCRETMQWIVFCASLWILITECKSNQDQITRPGTQTLTSSFKDSGVTAVCDAYPWRMLTRPLVCCMSKVLEVYPQELSYKSKLDTALKIYNIAKRWTFDNHRRSTNWLSWTTYLVFCFL